MGALVGLLVVGLLVVGKLVVGLLVVGLILGLNVGLNVGFNVGVNVGLNVGRKVGLNVGKSITSRGGTALDAFDLAVLVLAVLDLLPLAWSSLIWTRTRSPLSSSSSSAWGPLDPSSRAERPFLPSTRGASRSARIKRRSFRPSKRGDARRSPTRGAACSARTKLGSTATARMTATVAATVEEERR